jgi:hypothetical protein
VLVVVLGSAAVLVHVGRERRAGAVGLLELDVRILHVRHAVAALERLPELDVGVRRAALPGGDARDLLTRLHGGALRDALGVDVAEDPDPPVRTLDLDHAAEDLAGVAA